jgi:AAA+ ATPase superfamily predicted ATPase
MQFINREKETTLLRKISTQAYKGSAALTLLVGRRRIGKTELLKHAYQEDDNFIYLFCARKSEALLAEEFIGLLSAKLDLPTWIKKDSLLAIFEFLLQAAIDKPLTIAMDEFQDLRYINSAIFSDLQNLWDSYKNKTKLHLICCGSIYSIMCKLFEDHKEPLFGRADHKILLKALQPQYLRQILVDEKKYSPGNLLNIYTIVGGVPRYLELLYKQHAWELDEILDVILEENSFFLNEGKDVLIEEFGKEYKTYFSILSLIASGKTSRPAIESVLQNITIGGYMDNLEHQFSIIQKYRPIFAKENSRNQKYFINDNFLNFWFRYFYRHSTALAIGNFKYVKERIKEDFITYSGKYLEKLIRELLAASNQYNQIGNYWESDNSNEIDVVACNDYEKKLLICDVKLQAENLNAYLLETKAKRLVQQSSNYSIEYGKYSIEDLDNLIDNLN